MSIAAQYYFVKEGRSGRYSYILGEIYQEQAVPHRMQLYKSRTFPILKKASVFVEKIQC